VRSLGFREHDSTGAGARLAWPPEDPFTDETSRRGKGGSADVLGTNDLSERSLSLCVRDLPIGSALHVKETPPKDTHVLLVGYPRIVRRKGEHISGAKMAPLSKGLMLLASDVPSFFDYSVVLIRDLAEAANLGPAFARILDHRGVVAMGFRPPRAPCVYELKGDNRQADAARKRYNALWKTFFGQRISSIFKDKIRCRSDTGKHLIPVGDATLGQPFSRTDVDFEFGATFEPTEGLESLDLLLERTSRITGKPTTRPRHFEIFLKNPGGNPVGVVVRTGSSTLVLHPIPRPQRRADGYHLSNLAPFTRELLDSVKPLLDPHQPEENPPPWMSTAFSDDRKAVEAALTALDLASATLELQTALCWETGARLEEAVSLALRLTGVDVENVTSEGGQRDLVAELEGRKVVVEVRGKYGAVDHSDVSRLGSGNLPKELLLVINHYREIPPEERQSDPATYAPLAPPAIKAIRSSLTNGAVSSFRYLTTIDLAALVRQGGGVPQLLAALKPIG
jgi:hypothetical protein